MVDPFFSPWSVGHRPWRKKAYRLCKSFSVVGVPPTTRKKKHPVYANPQRLHLLINPCMLKISIPKPCHEDWEAMTPNTQGRHCNSCVKTVVDFTGMSDEEVKYFFLHKKEDKVCGRFKAEQVQRITIQLPDNIFIMPIPFWKKFLAASLLVFSTTLFSCDTRLTGDVSTTQEQTSVPNETIVGKLVAPPAPPPLLGDTTIALPQVCTMSPHTIVGVMVVPPITVEQGEPIIKGDVDIIDTVPYIKPVNPDSVDLIMGDAKMVIDSTTIKNPPKADTGNCDKQIFY